MTAEQLSCVLDSIFGSLGRLGRLIAARRRPGLDPSVMRAQFAARGLTVHDDLAELYGLCDGTDTFIAEKLGAIDFFPGYHWLKLDDALTIYDGIPDDPTWNRNWFPIFANGGGDFRAVISNVSSKDFGGVVRFLRGEPDCFVEFQNVVTMFEVINRSFAEQAFYMRDGRLVADFPKMRIIAQSLQPGFEVHDAER